MYTLFEQHPSWVSYALEVLYYLKKLYDRGFDVGWVTDFTAPILVDYLNILFGEDNLIWEDLEVEAPPEFNTLDEDSDYYWSIKDYLDRKHYTFMIKIEALTQLEYLNQLDYKRLLRTIQKVITPVNQDKEEFFYPHWSLFESVDWWKNDAGNMIGISFHLADIYGDGEEPYFVGHYLSAFLKFWDMLQRFLKEADANAGRQKRLYILKGVRGWRDLAGRRGLNPKRKNDRSQIAA